MLLFKRCRLDKDGRVKWCYIPEQFAIEGELLRLREPNGEWDGGWMVAVAPEYSICESAVLAQPKTWSPGGRAHEHYM